ncbi:MAG: hypothetical protein DDT27_01306 [Dehalococcoidia bacterium]|nr:hypothetical protein [Chloroflexota bacterium]MBT9162744.1 hypothetical protein [Chloroflexota bacterium]
MSNAMRSDLLQFTLSFTGELADEHRIDLYDVSQAIIGFQRSIALTTHLVLNQKIITQAPALKGAEILAFPPTDGSWKINSVVVLTAMYGLGTLENNSPLGHLVYSLYDYVVSESLGVRVDLNKSLGQLYEETQKNNVKLPLIKQHQADSLIEKCNTAMHEIHRPIYMTGTAGKAEITATINRERLPLETSFSMQTWEYIHETRTSDEEEAFVGRVSSYNSNTFKGRIYVEKFGRPVSFELSKNSRGQKIVQIVTSSLQSNALRAYKEDEGRVYFKGYQRTSRSGQLKSLLITDLSDKPIGN